MAVLGPAAAVNPVPGWGGARWLVCGCGLGSQPRQAARDEG